MTPPKITRNPNRAKGKTASRMAQRPTVRWSKVKRGYMPGKTVAARERGHERQTEARIRAIQDYYRYSLTGSIWDS